MKTIILICLLFFGWAKHSSGNSLFKNKNKSDTTLKYSPLKIRGYFNLLGNDIKEQFTAPFNMNNKQVLNLGLFTCATAALFFTDHAIDVFARTSREKSNAVSSASPKITSFGATYGFYTVGALELTGIIFNDKKLETTGLLASQSMITSGIMTRLGKIIFGRERPSVAYETPSYSKGGKWHGAISFFDSWIDDKKIPGAGYDAFPSGHTSFAFSIATVYASMYNEHLAVPIISYSVASLVGLSRLTEHAHWSSDIFVGAALGYLCGKQVVNNYRKLNHITPTHRHHKNISLSMDYSGKTYFAGMKYSI